MFSFLLKKKKMMMSINVTQEPGELCVFTKSPLLHLVKDTWSVTTLILHIDKRLTMTEMPKHP